MVFTWIGAKRRIEGFILFTVFSAKIAIHRDEDIKQELKKGNIVTKIEILWVIRKNLHADRFKNCAQNIIEVWILLFKTIKYTRDKVSTVAN
jgi:hypothetical protein